MERTRREGQIDIEVDVNDMKILVSCIYVHMAVYTSTMLDEQWSSVFGKNVIMRALVLCKAP